MSGFLSQFMQADQGRSMIASRPTLMSLLQSIQGGNSSGSSLSGTSSAGGTQPTAAGGHDTKGGAGATAATGAPFTAPTGSTNASSGLWPWSTGGGYPGGSDNSLMK